MKNKPKEHYDKLRSELRRVKHNDGGLHSAVATAGGMLSVCWENMKGTGEFDSTTAGCIVDEIMNLIAEDQQAMSHELNRLREFLHNEMPELVQHPEERGYTVSSAIAALREYKKLKELRITTMKPQPSVDAHSVKSGLHDPESTQRSAGQDD